MNTTYLGKQGEDLACRYLKRNGYKILERNFRFNKNEIDIVAQDGNYLVFVEVKSRSSVAFGLPREAVTKQKQQFIVECATYYLTKNKLMGKPVRFDVVEICGKDVNLLKDAYRM